MGKPPSEPSKQLGFGVRILIILVAGGITAYGVWIAVTGVWFNDGPFVVEGPAARVVGVVVALIGLSGLIRTALPRRRRP